VGGHLNEENRMKFHSRILAIFQFIRGRAASNEEILLLFVVCVFFIHVWSVVVLFTEIPTLILRANIWELIGVIAYVLAFDLFESVFVAAVLVLISIILPQKMFRNLFVPQGAMVVSLISGWAMSIQGQGALIRNWNIMPVVVLLAIFYALIHRFEKVQSLLFRTAKAMSVLSFTYVAFDVVGVFIVLLRNLL
jgi:hypothetical protein